MNKKASEWNRRLFFMNKNSENYKQKNIFVLANEQIF